MKKKTRKVEQFKTDQEQALITAESLRKNILTKVFRWKGVSLNHAETVASDWHRKSIKNASEGEIPRMPSDGELAVMIVRLMNNLPLN
ncbi:MAG: hypothetical protein ACRC8A_00560 [Microcoleaceae cyanobacterium]